jgi:hypothetical protein
MKKTYLTLIIMVFPLTGYSSNEYSYAEKCAELIEQVKSPTANWSTSNQEAAMAGECIGAIKAITTLSTNITSYSCKSGSVVKHAERIVKSKAVTINHVTKALCYWD